MADRKMIYLDDAIDALTDYFSFINPIAFVDILSALPPAEPETEERMPESAQNVSESDVIYRKDAIEAMSESLKRVFPEHRQISEKCLNDLPSAQPDIAENLYLYKCYITDKDGLQHEVVHTGDIRRVTGWEI